MSRPLNPSQALELADFLSEPGRLAGSSAAALQAAHLAYASRSARALVANDLRDAIRSAEISIHALALHARQVQRSEPSYRPALFGRV